MAWELDPNHNCDSYPDWSAPEEEHMKDMSKVNIKVSPDVMMEFDLLTTRLDTMQREIDDVKNQVENIGKIGLKVLAMVQELKK